MTPANRYLLGSSEYFMNAKHAVIEEQLEKQPGEHLVLVSYGPRHQIYEELVYNHADIDRIESGVGAVARGGEGRRVDPALSESRGLDGGRRTRALR